MTLQKNKTAAATSGGGDEIDEIMNEIEELQQSMSASQASPAKAKAAAPIQEAETEPKVNEEVNEPSGMEDFRGGSDDVSMEETLANLKDDEPSGPNLIDQAMEAEAAAAQGEDETAGPETVEAATAESTESEDELLNDAESDALDEAVAEAEEAVLAAAEAEEAINESEEEEVTMSEAPRRGRVGSGQPTVSVKLTGDMLLRLSYEFEGQEVLVGFADGALRVELSDGTEFKIPVRRSPVRKAA
jgi:hypothetical protein